MNLERIHRRTAQLLAEAKEKEQAGQVHVIFYIPEVDEMPPAHEVPAYRPSENPPLHAVHIYLPVKKTL